jgi:hypothetical protein
MNRIYFIYIIFYCKQLKVYELPPSCQGGSLLRENFPVNQSTLPDVKSRIHFGTLVKKVIILGSLLYYLLYFLITAIASFMVKLLLSRSISSAQKIFEKISDFFRKSLKISETHFLYRNMWNK